MKPVIFLPEAREEMYEAAGYYESQASGLGKDFLSEVESAVASVAENPLAWPLIEVELRRRMVHRFPFGILYYIGEEEIVIAAVAHLKRRPGYWEKRVSL